MNVLVFGATTLLGSTLAETAADRGHDVVGTYRTEEALPNVTGRRYDATDTDGVADLVASEAPDAVVHCVEMDDVGACEQEPAAARRINAEVPAAIAEQCADIGAQFVYVSTDYVFDGETETDYGEADDPDPVQTYGETKLAGERAVAEAHPGALVVRVSFLWGVHRGLDRLYGFPARVLDILRNDRHLSLSADRELTPSRADNVADRTLGLLDADESGTFHVASRTCLTPFDFGTRLGDLLGAPPRLVHANPPTGRKYPVPRPRRTCLDVAKLEATLGVEQPTIDDDLATVDVA